MSLVRSIATGDLISARKYLEERMESIMAQKLHETKKRMMAELDLSREKPDYGNVEDRRNDQVSMAQDKTDLPTKVPASKPTIGSSPKIDITSKNIKPPVMKEETLDEANSKNMLKIKSRYYKDLSKRLNDLSIDVDSNSDAISDLGRHYIGAPGSDKRKQFRRKRMRVNQAAIVADKMLQKEETLDEVRIKIIKARIRGGKIQRRKRISNVPGMTFRGGTLKRMSPAERRRRKLGQRRGKIKRKATMSRSIMKRARSMRKRKSMGI